MKNGYRHDLKLTTNQDYRPLIERFIDFTKKNAQYGTWKFIKKKKIKKSKNYNNIYLYEKNPSTDFVILGRNYLMEISPEFLSLQRH